MSEPIADAKVPPEPTADDFLITTEVDEDGNFSSKRLKIQDMPSELLFYFGSNGNDRAMAELATRMVTDMAEKAAKT